MPDLAEGGSVGWDRGDWLLFGWLREFHPVALPLLKLVVFQTALWLGRRDFAELGEGQVHTVPVAFALEVVPSFPFDCTGRLVGKDMAGAHLGGSKSVHTCCCYCIMEVPAFESVDTDPLVHQENMASVLLALEQQYALGPEQLGLGLLVLVACSMPRLAVVAACLGQEID